MFFPAVTALMVATTCLIVAVLANTAQIAQAEENDVLPKQEGTE